jgi:hypothetical protein
MHLQENNDPSNHDTNFITICPRSCMSVSKSLLTFQSALHADTSIKEILKSEFARMILGTILERNFNSLPSW